MDSGRCKGCSSARSRSDARGLDADAEVAGSGMLSERESDTRRVFRVCGIGEPSEKSGVVARLPFLLSLPPPAPPTGDPS